MPGVLGSKELLALYAQGLFPMADSRDDKRAAIVDPPKRGILPLDALHVSRRLRRTVRQNIYEVRIDTAFGAVCIWFPWKHLSKVLHFVCESKLF